MTGNVSRRYFIQGLAGSAALGATACRTVKPRKPAGEKINIAVIGTTHRAAENIANILDENIVALCDIDDRYLAKASDRFPKAKAYNDFRVVLDESADIDAFVISTPDHIHAPATVGAMLLGKHVYCEKPLTHSVYEARVVAQTAKRMGVATQMGTQIHAGDNYRRVVEVIQSGAIGPVTEVHVWVGKGWSGGDRPKEVHEIPKYLHWDLWLGPAPMRDYNEAYLPQEWRRRWDFGGGTLGDMGCHYIDCVFWALGLRHPLTAEAEGPPVNPDGAPANLKVRWEFPARGPQPPVELTWYDGDLRPPLIKERGLPNWGAGIIFVGEKGLMQADYNQYKLYPENEFKGYVPPPQTIPASIGHYKEWFQAIRTGSPTTCNFDYSGALTETVLLGNVAFRTGKKLEWDPKRLRATNCPEAEQFIRREYRKGWKLV